MIFYTIILIFGSVILLTDEFLEVVESLTGELTLGFEGEILEDLTYQTMISSNMDCLGEDTGDDSVNEDIATSSGFISFFTFLSSVNADLASNLTESLTAVIAPFLIIIVLGFDNVMNESYNGTIAPWLWPFFTLLEILTLVFRCISLSIRLTSNTLAGHILLGLLSLSTTIAFEYALFWYLHVLAITLGLLTLIIQLMEFIVTLIQAYVWVILTLNYTYTL